MVGSQTPDYRYCLDYTLTEGDQAADLAAAYALNPHPWQRSVLRDWLAVDENGTLLNTLCLLPVSRQNGKTGVCDPRMTWGLVKRAEQILFTAQEFQTAQKAFQRFREKFGDKPNDPYARYPELNALVKRYTTSANQMVVDLHNGGHIEFRTRGNSSDVGRGGTFDLIVIDEAQSYTKQQDAALSPLNSAAPSGSPQTILMGTVPDPAYPLKGAVFLRLRNSAHDNPTEGICINEWGAQEVGDVFDRSRWYKHNPSLGYQLLESALEKDARGMDPDTFAMEHLGWFPANIGKVEPAIPIAQWMECRTDKAPNSPPACYGVKFSPDGQHVAVSVTVKVEDRWHVELAEHRGTSNGMGWLLDAMERHLETPWVIDGKSGTSYIQQQIGDRFEPGMLTVPSANEAIAAASGLLEAVKAREMTWFRPNHIETDQLTLSAQESPRRAIGRDGGWGFGGSNSAPIESAALALWGAQTKTDTEEEETGVWF